MQKFDLKKMRREIKEDEQSTQKTDHRLSRAGLKKLVTERREQRKGKRKNGTSQ